MHYINQPVLRDAMYMARMTQAQAAEAAGLPLSTFKSYLHQQRSVPLDAVTAIAEALQCDPFSLIGPRDPASVSAHLTISLGVTPEKYSAMYEAVAA